MDTAIDPTAALANVSPPPYFSMWFLSLFFIFGMFREIRRITLPQNMQMSRRTSNAQRNAFGMNRAERAKKNSVLRVPNSLLRRLFRLNLFKQA